MRICIAQLRPVKGDVQRNIEKNKRLIDEASLCGARVVIFPELSLTGYEPTFANTLATDPEDRQFDDFQAISRATRITIGVGIPIKTRTRICVGMVLFRPHKPRKTYFKKYLHRDEEVFFVSGEAFPALQIDGTKIALAICYELSVDEHAETASGSAAKVYIASVAKTVKGTDAICRLSDIASRYSMIALMANCIGESDGWECAGKTSIWNNRDTLVDNWATPTKGFC